MIKKHFYHISLLIYNRSKDVPGEATHGRPPRGKSSLQSGPSEKTNILNFDGGMKIITFEEPQKTILEPQKTILEPLDEVSESPLEVKSYSSPLTSNGKLSCADHAPYFR